jgi:hypothetical protein
MAFPPVAKDGLCRQSAVDVPPEGPEALARDLLERAAREPDPELARLLAEAATRLLDGREPAPRRARGSA